MIELYFLFLMVSSLIGIFCAVCQFFDDKEDDTIDMYDC